MDLQIQTTFVFGWVGFGKPGVQISNDEKICTPRNLVFIHIFFFKLLLYLMTNYFLKHSNEIERHCII